MPSRLLWGLGWLLVVVTASVFVLEAGRTRQSERRLHRELRLGLTWILCGTVVGVGLACWAWLSGNLPTDDAEGVTVPILAGSLVGGMTCLAYWASGLIIRAFTGPTKPHGGDDGKKPAGPEIEGAP